GRKDRFHGLFVSLLFSRHSLRGSPIRPEHRGPGNPVRTRKLYRIKEGPEPGWFSFPIRRLSAQGTAANPGHPKKPWVSAVEKSEQMPGARQVTNGVGLIVPPY